MDQSRATQSHTISTSDGGTGEPVRARDWNVVGNVAWVVLSVAFVGYLAFGSVGARIWRFGQLEIEPKSIRGVWQAQVRSLPDVSNGWLLELALNGSALVLVACVVLLMRYLLIEAREELAAVEPDQM